MLRLGRIAIYVAVILVAGGLVTGFGALFTGHQEMGIALLSLVPAGVLAGFAGVVIIVLNEPRQGE